MAGGKPLSRPRVPATGAAGGTGARPVEAAISRSRLITAPPSGGRRSDGTEVIGHPGRAGPVENRTGETITTPITPKSSSSFVKKGPDSFDSPRTRRPCPPHSAPADSRDREPRQQPAQQPPARQQQVRVGEDHEPQHPRGGIARHQQAHRAASQCREGRRTSPDQPHGAAPAVRRSPAGPTERPRTAVAASGSARRHPCLGSVGHHHTRALP